MAVVGECRTRAISTPGSRFSPRSNTYSAKGEAIGGSQWLALGALSKSLPLGAHPRCRTEFTLGAAARVANSNRQGRASLRLEF